MSAFLRLLSPFDEAHIRFVFAAHKSCLHTHWSGLGSQGTKRSRPVPEAADSHVDNLANELAQVLGSAAGRRGAASYSPHWQVTEYDQWISPRPVFTGSGPGRCTEQAGTNSPLMSLRHK